MKNYPKVILINIDNFNAFQTDKPMLIFKVRDEDGHIETEMYESIHLVLANINNSQCNIDREIKKFARFLKERDLERLREDFRGDEKYMAAIRTVEDLTTDEDLIGSYDYEEAKEQEILMLKLENEELKQRNIETVKKMLAKKFSTEEIVEITGLTKEEIFALEKEMKI